jgi:hypothetical protein
VQETADASTVGTTGKDRRMDAYDTILEVIRERITDTGWRKAQEDLSMLVLDELDEGMIYSKTIWELAERYVDDSVVVQALMETSLLDDLIKDAEEIVGELKDEDLLDGIDEAAARAQDEIAQNPERYEAARQEEGGRQS